VDDLADAHIRALDRLRAGAPDAAFNLGTGIGFSVKQVVEKVKEVSGEDFKVIPGPPRAGDPPSLVADPGEAVKTLGWRPTHSSLHEIVSTAYRWLKAHPKGY
jgi:UDP-glucose 4-epimerase